MPQTDDSWNRKMVAFLASHYKDTKPTAELPPVAWDGGVKHGTLHGSPNQHWLSTADLIAAFDPWGVLHAIDRYKKEQLVGQEELEENAASHMWEHLTAHLAIRAMAIRRRAEPNMAQLLALNTLWWGGEIGLEEAFYVPGVGVVAPSARFEGSYISTPRNEIALHAVGGHAGIHVPRNGGTDVWCLQVAAELVAAGDDLGKSLKHVPFLAVPVYVCRAGGGYAAYWEPSGSGFTGPITYSVEVRGGQIIGSQVPGAKSAAAGPFVPVGLRAAA